MAQSRAKPKSHSNFITQLPDKDLPDLTLCLVTYNSAEWLEGWTKAIENLNYPRQKLKISWVDNNSSDNTLEIMLWPMKQMCPVGSSLKPLLNTPNIMTR